MPINQYKKIPFFKFLSLMLLMSLILFSAQIEASIVISGTRVIYAAGERSVTIKLNNNGKQPVLIQSWVDDGNANLSPDISQAPFLVTPPLNRVDPGKGQTLKISFTGTQLPADKESVFWLNVLEVPTKHAAAQSDNYLQIAFRTRIKLFYRPDNLTGKPIDAPDLLEWKSVNGKLQATNHTPWNVSVSRVISGSKKTDGLMIAPFATTIFPLNISTGSTISFDTVNDYGAVINKTAAVK